jgi:hypothetical protein
VRRVLYAPRNPGQPGSIIAQYTDIATGSLLRLERQAAVRARVPTRAVAAALTASGDMLLVCLAIPARCAVDESTATTESTAAAESAGRGAEGAALRREGIQYVRFQAYCLATWQPKAPPIDVADVSSGLAAPVFCLRHAFVSASPLPSSMMCFWAVRITRTGCAGRSPSFDSCKRRHAAQAAGFGAGVGLSAGQLGPERHRRPFPDHRQPRRGALAPV